MAIYNLGSINVDHFYQVKSFATAGETISSSRYKRGLGGKGANQSIALSLAGAKVRHIGAINYNEVWIINELNQFGIDTQGIHFAEQATGHAIIQVNEHSENCIVLFKGANFCLKAQTVQQELKHVTKTDWLLLQNETSLRAETVAQIRRSGCSIIYNPAPMDIEVVRELADKVDVMVVNETELLALAGIHDVDQAITHLLSSYPELTLVVTLGVAGSVYVDREQRIVQPAFPVQAVDTTAAGDTFLGYFLAAIDSGQPPQRALLEASAAAAICVTRAGTSAAIPNRNEVLEFMTDTIVAREMVARDTQV